MSQWYENLGKNLRLIFSYVKERIFTLLQKKYIYICKSRCYIIWCTY